MGSSVTVIRRKGAKTGTDLEQLRRDVTGLKGEGVQPCFKRCGGGER